MGAQKMTAEFTKKLRNMTLYLVSIRNYEKVGTFIGIEADFDRIKEPSVDIT